MRRAATLLRRRVISAIPVLLIVLVFTFVLLENASGDAVDAYLVSIGGGDAGLRDALREQYGLNGSVLARFWLYASSVLRLDFGWSLAFDRPVLGLILERLPNTLLLMGSATALAFIIGTALGILAGARPGGLTDRVLSALSLALYATPGFWLGLVLAIVFAVQLRWLPTSGIETIASGKQGFVRALDIARHLVLPVASLGLIYLALFLRVMRTAMAAVWPLDFVLFAKAKGLSRRRIVLRHVARNAALPLVTVLGLQAATMLGGSVVIESVFAIPGFGRLAQEAVSGRDTPLLMGIILTSAVFVILINLVVDILYAVFDPRIGSGEQQT
ncbi:putative ABC transporter, permease protein [Agrobacterium fabacearum CFBP 5771]|uniref:ABC transporter permease n=1 Tax=Rhizobium/Agrobacterium group TaxID=227290 RepID=UPI000200B832|nr:MULTISPECIES: ABC transporter permease [Rhizobium/Agrobacterium group]ADY66372.1 oligopeptide ABC transporter, membrane spanning protein [Agrobacterium tumefaciens]AYM12614.1 peptide/nickel transport system permease protein [Agrobacterium tumefaciens]KQY44882.1 ABC transporter permease [Rhizobium sp. Root491]NSY91766.1 ABC transporter permease [Agrobacterium tumefaciens]NTA60205.1 ABC transporter permease [Agrobacterium tumefaciens]